MLQSDSLLCKYCGSYFDTEIHIPRKIPQCGHTICEGCLIKKYNGSRKLLMCKVDRKIISLQKIDEDEFDICQDIYKQVLNNLNQQKTKVKNEIQFNTDNIVGRRRTEDVSQNKLHLKKYSKTNTAMKVNQSQEDSEHDVYQSSNDSFGNEDIQKNDKIEVNKENDELRNTVDETCYLLQNLQFAFNQNLDVNKNKEPIQLSPEKLKKFEETFKEDQEFLKKYSQDDADFKLQIEDQTDTDKKASDQDEYESSEDDYDPQQKLSTLQVYERAGVFKDSLVSTVSFADRDKFINNNLQVQTNKNFTKKPTPPKNQKTLTPEKPKQRNDSKTITISVNGMCWIHKNIQQQIFCLQCQTKICYQCAFEQHKNHRSKQIQQIQGEVSQYEQDLEKLLNQIDEREREQQKDLFIKKIQEITINKKENFIEQINNFVKEQVRKIKEFGKNVKNEIEIILEQKQKESEELVKKCDLESEQQLSQMKQKLENIQNLMENQGDDVEKYVVILNNIQQVMQFSQCRQVVDNVRKYVNKVDKMSKDNINSLQLDLKLKGEYKHSIKIKRSEDIIEQQNDKNIETLFQDQLSPIQNLDLLQQPQQNVNINNFNRQQSQPQIYQFPNKQNNLQVYNWKDRLQKNNPNQYQHSYQNNLYSKSQRNLNVDNDLRYNNNIQLQVPNSNKLSTNQSNYNQSSQDDSEKKSNITEEDLIQKLSINEQNDIEKSVQNVKQMQMNQQSRQYEKSRGRRAQNFISHNTSLTKLHENKSNFQQNRYPPINRKDTGNKSTMNPHNNSNNLIRSNRRNDSSMLNYNNMSRTSNNRDNQGVYGKPFRKQQSEANLNFQSGQKNRKHNDSLNKSINRKLSGTHLQTSMEFNKKGQKEICNLYSNNKKYLNLNNNDQKSINNILDLEKRNIGEIKKNLKDPMNQEHVYQINLSQMSKLKRCQSRTYANIVQIIKRVQKFKKSNNEQKYVRCFIYKKTLQ